MLVGPNLLPGYFSEYNVTLCLVNGNSTRIMIT